MSKPCKVSVVMPCFNHGEFVQEAVDSVILVGRDDMELIVVDDGSTDERTRGEMDALSARGIKVIRQENEGLAAARNAGVLAAQGEYIFPLDADDRLRSGWIDRGIGILSTDPQVGVVYGDAQCFGIRENLWRTAPFDMKRLLFRNFIHASALYRRSVWEQNGGYDGTMPVQGYEDWDFWLGAVEHGWQLTYLPEVFFDYRQAPGSMITKAIPFEAQIRDFVGRKHGILYEQAWLSMLTEHQTLSLERQSVKATSRNLARLLKSRLKSKLQREKLDGQA
jgi:glycosyltransferase involved in cell wall biosynthesis